MTIPDWLRLRTARRGQAAHGEVFPSPPSRRWKPGREALALAEDEGRWPSAPTPAWWPGGAEGGGGPSPRAGRRCWRPMGRGDRDPGPAVGGLEPEGAWGQTWRPGGWRP